MRKYIAGFAGLALASAVLLSSCSGTPLSTREEGTLGGGALGAGAGALVGAAVGHPAAGALIGGGMGALGGFAVGNQMQNQEAANQQTQDRKSVV